MKQLDPNTLLISHIRSPVDLAIACYDLALTLETNNIQFSCYLRKFRLDTALNFAWAQSDTYCSNIGKRNGGSGEIRHDRTATPDVLLSSPRDTFTFEDITGMVWIEIDLPRILSSIDNPSKAVIINQTPDQDGKRIQ